jgi:DNA-binding PadR family transcriptional regulator
MIKAPLTMELALLGFLRDEPMHAYEMHQQLHRAEALGLVWRIKQSQLYALLARLEEAGYLTTVTTPQETRPARKMLHLTPAGRAAFEVWRITPVQHGRDLRQEFLAKLYFAQQEGAAYVEKLVEAQRVACQTILAALRARAEAAEQPYARLVFEFRCSQVEATYQWLDRCMALLVDPANPSSSSISGTSSSSAKDNHLLS